MKNNRFSLDKWLWELQDLLLNTHEESYNPRCSIYHHLDRLLLQLRYLFEIMYKESLKCDLGDLQTKLLKLHSSRSEAI